MLRVRLLRAETDPVPAWNRKTEDVIEDHDAFPTSDAAPAFLAAAAPALTLPLDLELQPAALLKLLRLPRRRKNAKNLTQTEWAQFIGAIEIAAVSTAPAPSYEDFVALHAKTMDPSDHSAHGWGVHNMGSHDGRNFLAWHREYLVRLEARLRKANPLVTIPYWDWVNDRQIPAALTQPADIEQWGITRGTFRANLLPTQAQINAVMANSSFAAFQTALESPHNWVHNAVGGTMASGSSPADPIFWLHHAMVDKLWADWQKTHKGADDKPSNASEKLLEAPIIKRKVSQVLSTRTLGYIYV